MLKRFINGLVFGCGFALACFVVLIIGTKLFARYRMNSLEAELESTGIHLSSGPIDRAQDVAKEAPAFSGESEKFLGSHGIYSDGFTDIKGKVLASGPGVIRGKITANGKPTAGLKLRLALNKAVMSQWGVSGGDGIYSIEVPYGKYVIGGYELDTESAHSELAGLIDAPYRSCDSGEFVVDADHPGDGLNLEYVDPVVKLTTGVAYKPDDGIVLSWQKYPGADRYTVQLREKQSATDYRFKNLFEDDVDVANTTTLDLAPYREKLKPGHYYSYDVHAVTADGETISESAFEITDYDFRINQVHGYRRTRNGYNRKLSVQINQL